MKRPCPAAAALGAGLLLIAGCATWSSPSLTPQQVLANADQGRAWVVLRGDTVPVVVVQGHVANDTLYARIDHSAAPGHPLTAFTAPLSSVQRVATRHVSWAHTAVVVFVPVGLAVIARFLVGP